MKTMCNHFLIEDVVLRNTKKYPPRGGMFAVLRGSVVN